MAIQSLNILKSWVVARWKPTVVQVKDWMDSFWHKQDTIPMASVGGLTNALTGLATQEAVNNVLTMLYGERVAYAGTGAYAIANNVLLEKIIITPVIESTIRVGTTVGGDDLLADTVIAAGNKEPLQIDRYEGGTIYITGVANGTPMIFFKRFVLPI